MLAQIVVRTVLCAVPSVLDCPEAAQRTVRTTLLVPSRLPLPLFGSNGFSLMQLHHGIDDLHPIHRAHASAVWNLDNQRLDNRQSLRCWRVLGVRD